MLIKIQEITGCLNKRPSDHLLQNRSTTKISSDRRCVKSISDIAQILAIAIERRNTEGTRPIHCIGLLYRPYIQTSLHAVHYFRVAIATVCWFWI